MARRAASLALVMVPLVCALAGCGSQPPEITVSYPGQEDDSSFHLVNASDGEWTDVRVVLRAMRPDGIEEQCAQEHFPSWRPGSAQVLPKCPGEKMLITIETGGGQAFFVFAEGKLFRKIGRKEIPL